MGSTGTAKITVKQQQQTREREPKEPKGEITHEDAWVWYGKNEDRVIKVNSEKGYTLLQHNAVETSKKKDLATTLQIIENYGKKKGYTSDYIMLSAYIDKSGQNDLKKFNDLGYEVIAYAKSGGTSEHPKREYILKKKK